MTKISVFGEEPKKEKELKKIELVYYLSRGKKQKSATTRAGHWGNIMLVSNDGEYDIMLAWDGQEASCGTVYLGHWNDGVV